MPNAINAHTDATRKILLLGDTGSGKTTQFLTLPGKKFIYLFDPNALQSLKGHDVDYEEYMPSTVGAAVASLSKSGVKDPSKARTSDVYQQFESEFEGRLADGFFDQYDWLGFDSATTLLDLIMDRVLTINGRFGQWPNQDDYGPQMVAFTNLCRTVTAMGKNLFMTGHLDVRQDEVTKKITNRPMMTGRLVSKIPLLFSDIFYTDVDTDEKGSTVYRIQTRPNGINRTIRTAVKGLEPYEDVTVNWSEPVVGQGLGGILNWAENAQK